MVSWYYCANYLIYEGTGCKGVSREVRMTTMLWYTSNADKWADARHQDSTWREMNLFQMIIKDFV